MTTEDYTWSRLRSVVAIFRLVMESTGDNQTGLGAGWRWIIKLYSFLKLRRTATEYNVLKGLAIYVSESEIFTDSKTFDQPAADLKAKCNSFTICIVLVPITTSSSLLS